MTDNAKTIDPCGCCDLPSRPTPVDVRNRPGLSQIAYRVGTYGTFRQAMIDSIASMAIAVEGETQPRRPLADWTARTNDDYGIALLEMWAYVAEILTFYQERIANEAFLRSAVFRESLLRLATTMDYKPAPGVAATAYLALSVEAGKKVHVPAGLLVQSVPGQDEKPQKFETVDPIEATGQLNKLRIYPASKPFDPAKKNNDLITAITDIDDLAPADKLVVWGTASDGVDRFEDKIVTRIRSIGWRTEVEFDPPIRQRLTGAHWQKWNRKFRLFGHNAPETFLSPVVQTGNGNGAGEVLFKESTFDFTSSATVGTNDTTIKLSAIDDDLKLGAPLLVTAPGKAVPVRVTAVQQVDAVVGDGVPLMQATVSQITVDAVIKDLDSRHTTIYGLQGSEIGVWDRQYPATIPQGQRDVFLPLVELGIDSKVAKTMLQPGHRVVIGDGQGAPFSTAIAAAKTVTADHLKVTLEGPLDRSVDAEASVMFANIAKATHGETISAEVLGSGDAAAEFQRFALKKSPLTYVPRAGAPGGAASTLEVRVDGVLWHEVRSLHRQPADSRVFTTTIDSDGVTWVQFGDGIEGARLPSGRNNVVASYRLGIGRAGNVLASTLKNLLDRPVGLNQVINLDAARGGAQPEAAEKIRRNIPNSVRTFGRIVSLRDFEDAAREFAGIAKAKAFVDGIGIGRSVRLTVAGDDDTEVSGAALSNLADDLNARRDPTRPMTVGSYRRVPIRIEVAIWVDPNYQAESVVSETAQALQAKLHFDALDLGQPIHLSDVYQATHDVDGVTAGDVNRLQFKADSDADSHGASADPVQPRLAIFATELAVVDDPAVDIVVTVETVSS